MLNQDQLEKAQSIQLSEHFTLFELIKSDSYPELVEWPSDSIISRLEYFCTEILEPIRVKFGRIRIQSGWRNTKLNSAVGGELNSVHQILYRGVSLGVAADIKPLDADLIEVFDWAFASIPKIKTAILYRKPSVTKTPFIHLDTRANRVGRAKLEKVANGEYPPYKG